MPYYDNVNPDLLSRIPLSASRVLEVGCGAGSLGRAYKLRNPSSTYCGLELDSASADQARQHLDHVVCVDVEVFDLADEFDELFDCIIYGDVLEHLKEPWTCLERHLKLLAPGGIVLACIPNVQHWSVLANLLHGAWPLEDQGLFDQTHLRWFTRSTARSLFEQLGMMVYEVKPRVFSPEKAHQFVEQLAPSLINLGVDRQQLLRDVAPLQYVFSAGFAQKQPLHIEALSQIKPEFMADVRIRQPLVALTSEPRVTARLSTVPGSIQSRGPNTDQIFLWQRPILGRTNESFSDIRQLIKLGFVVIVDFDDNPAAEVFSQMKNDFLTFKLAHAVQVSTPEIAEVVAEINPEVTVFPNDLLAVSPSRQSRDLSGLKIFFGALNRGADWRPYINTLNEVLESSPDFWSFEVVHDQEFFDALCLPESRKNFTPTCTHERYLRVMSACDIAFMPLMETPFNQMKSDLKAVEAASLGLAPLASRVVYGKSLVEGATGALFSDPGELSEILARWRQQPSDFVSIGANARHWVEDSRLIAHRLDDRLSWYRDVCRRRGPLTQAIYERVPDL